jgi:hypothetical protein
MVLPMPFARLFAIILRLFAQAQPLNELLVTLCIFTPQINQMATALAHKF